MEGGAGGGATGGGATGGGASGASGDAKGDAEVGERVGWWFGSLGWQEIPQVWVAMSLHN